MGWTPPDPDRELEYNDWIETGRQLGAFGRGSQWWVGDWLLYARGKWGEMYSEAVKVTGYDYGSLRNMVSLAQEFDLSRRRDTLSWGHHAAIAGLPQREQDQWLDRAVELKWSREDLRTELRSSRRALKAADREDQTGQPGGHLASLVCPHCGGTISLESEVPAK